MSTLAGLTYSEQMNAAVGDLGLLTILPGDRVVSKRFRYKERDAAKGPSLGKECNAVAGPFGRNPEGSGHLAPDCGLSCQMRAPCFGYTQAASPRLALGAKWPERDPHRECQQTLALFRAMPMADLGDHLTALPTTHATSH